MKTKYENSTLIACEEDISYCTDDQDIQLLFTFLKRKGTVFTEQFTPVSCRGTTSCMLYASKLKTLMTEGVYGYKCREFTSLKRLSLSLTLNSPSQFIEKIEVLHKLEALAGSARTRLIRPTNHASKVIVLAPRFWIKSPVLYSLYTLILRMMAYDIEIEEMTLGGLADAYMDSRYYDGEDCSNIETVQDDLEAVYCLLKHHKYIFRNNPITLVNDKCRSLKKCFSDTGNYIYITHEVDPSVKFSVTLCGLSHRGFVSFMSDTSSMLAKIKNNVNQDFIDKRNPHFSFLQKFKKVNDTAELTF